MIFIHYKCATYIINLTVKTEMNHIKNEIKKLYQFVIKIKILLLLLNKLLKIYIFKKIKFLKLILDINTC